MEDKKHIDRLFQENLKDFEVFPDTQVWQNIEQQLTKKKKKRRVFPLWLRIGGAAASLLFLISSGIWFFNLDDSPKDIPETNSIITDVDSKNNKNNIDNSKEKKNLQENQINLEKATDKKLKIPSKGTIQLKNKKTTRFANSVKKNEDNTSSEKTNKANNLTKDTNRPVIAIDTKKETLNFKLPVEINTPTELAIALSNKEELPDNKRPIQDLNDALKERENTTASEKDEQNLNRWSVGSTVAPVYFNSLTKGSPIDVALTENSKSSSASISYGVKVNYKINEKLSLQSGINAVELAYTTRNVTALISSNEALANSTNLNTNVEGFSIVTTSDNNLTVQGAELITERARSTTKNLAGDLDQFMNYIEIPMEAKYSLLQEKIGVNVVGGISTYILYKNGIAIQNQNGSTILGEASNVNNVNFSGNLGLDFDYKINKRLFLNVSPMFKYQLNTFSKNDGGFKPYYLGVYTGLNFRF